MRRAVIFIALLFVLPGIARADIYAYQDAQGRIRITDIPEKKGYELVLPPIRSTERTAASTAAPAASADATAYQPATTAPSSGKRDMEYLRDIVTEAARVYGISESLIYAVIRAESNFNPYAVSNAGALGLMQLIPSTARLVGVTRPFDPRQNIHGGARYLRMMIDRFGRVDHALAAYNAGPEAVARYGGIPPYSETMAYVPRVLRYYREYSGGNGPSLASVSVSSPRSSVAASASARAATRTQPVKNASGTPVFYYRGPDGQIYITNLNSNR